MNSEVEAEGRVKALPYKVRAASKESQAQRASQILDSDLRTHWSTSTNAKEWILLELEVHFFHLRLPVLACFPSCKSSHIYVFLVAWVFLFSSFLQVDQPISV